MNYDDLKPGYYLQVGDRVTALKSVSDATWQRLLTGDRETGLERLAASVGWVFTALDRRRIQLSEIPVQWRRNGDDMDGAPYKMRQRRLLAQTDTSMQIYGVAYWHKLRNRGGGVVGVAWLDPTTIDADYNRLDESGNIAWYRRQTDTGVMMLPATDVVRFTAVSLRELEPGPSAMQATHIAADLLYGADQALSSLFGNNALPIFLIKVPPGTSEPAKQELESRWRRLLMPKRRGSVDMRSTAVSADVSIEKLSLSPAELAIDALEDRNRDEILAAHGVPQSQVLGNAANFATADIDKVTFIGTMTGRLLSIADELAHDPDFGGAGYELVPMPDRLPVMQILARQRLESLKLAIEAGLPLDVAIDVVGLDLPDDVRAVLAATPEPVAPEPPPMPTSDDRRAVELASLRTFIANGTHRKRPFQSDILTPAEINAEIARMDGRKAVEDYGADYGEAIGLLIEQAIDGNVTRDEFEGQWRQLAYATCIRAYRRGLGIGENDALLPHESADFNQGLQREYTSIANATRDIFDALASQD